MASVILSSQNFDIYEGDGLDPFARTGATSAEQLTRAGAQGVILGHSEVDDTIEVVHAKLKTLIRRNILPRTTVLVGETWGEFENHSTEQIATIVAKHLRYILTDIPPSNTSQLVIGYEPKWGSRGSGRDDMPPPQVETIKVACAALREIVGTAVPVIYGGRSTPERTAEILADENVEGLILGSACNTLAKTMEIVRAMEQTRPHTRKVLHANFKAYELTDDYARYIEALRKLDDTFLTYVSPPATDIQEFRLLLESQNA